MTAFVDLAPAADQLAKLVAGTPDEQLAAPTPCSGRTVADLLSHLLMLTIAFRDGAEKAPDAGPPPSELPPLAPTWRSDLPAHLDDLVTAWRAPEARAGMASVGGVEMPAEMMAVVALDELVLHGWDLAVATGQPYEVDRESVAACLGFVAPMAQQDGVPGLFGPPVPVPADAPELHRLLGLSGRDPQWRSPVSEAAR